MIEKQDIELINNIRAGNLIAEKELIARFGLRISRKVRFALGASNTDWQDVVHEVQLALLGSLRQGRFNVEKGVPLGSYVYGITMNKLRDYFKTKKKQETLTTDALTEIADDEDFNLENQETRKILIRMMTRLKIKYKEVLYLRYYEDLSVSQISQKINLPPRRVSERIHYAVQLLRKECERENFFFNI